MGERTFVQSVAAVTREHAAVAGGQRWKTTLKFRSEFFITSGCERYH
jgi:hypothetical protein